MLVAPEFGGTPDSLVNISPNQVSLPRAETISRLKQIYLPLVVQEHLDHAGHVPGKKLWSPFYALNESRHEIVGVHDLNLEKRFVGN